MSNLFSFFGVHNFLDGLIGRKAIQYGSPELLMRARMAFRAGDISQADSLLWDCHEARDSDPACLNLLGAIAEARGQWPQARRFWQRALRSDRSCRAAETNLRRYYELFVLGSCRECTALGDEPDLSVALEKDES